MLQILENQEACVGCGACASACSKKCIEMKMNREGFFYPMVRTSMCVGCEKCKSVCPVLNISKPENIDTRAFAAYCYNEMIRYSSTSGGIFTLLCTWVIAHGGVIYGAAYDDHFKVVHIQCNSIEEVRKIQQAKYSQSDLSDCFNRIKEKINKKQYVLFSGTPCQVNALKSFLGKETPYLYLVDLICHGVPSPKVWNQYIAYRSEKDNGGEYPLTINMRSKETGWPAYSVSFEYKTGYKYLQKNNLDPYMRAFVKNLCLRKSCYECKFKGIKRVSDLTLGDYWGIWSQMPEFNDGRGASVILVHTQKGTALWNAVKDKCNYRELSPKLSVAENPSAENVAVLPKQREEFMKKYETEDFQELVDLLCPVQSPKVSKLSWLLRVKRKVKAVLKTGKLQE